MTNEDQIQQTLTMLTGNPEVGNTVSYLSHIDMIFYVSGFVFSVIAFFMANKKGYNGILWAGYTWGTWIFGLIQAVCLSDLLSDKDKKLKDDGIRKKALFFIGLQIIIILIEFM